MSYRSMASSRESALPLIRSDSRARPDFFRQNLRGRLVRCAGKLYFAGATSLQSA